MEEEIYTPGGLMPVGPSYSLASVNKVAADAIILFNNPSFSQPEVSVFRKPFRMKYHEKEGNMVLSHFSRIKSKRMRNVGWFVRPTASNLGVGLEAFFSRELVQEILSDDDGKSYDIRCTQNFATPYFGWNVESPSAPEAYFLAKKLNIPEIRKAMNFFARKTLHVFEGVHFKREDVEKLGNFFYEDYISQRHSHNSRLVGQEADSVFFP